jgi:hypothetical protein
MQPWRASLWLLPALWALACGGRYQQTIEGDDAPSAGTASGGQRISEAGRSSRAGSTSRAGGPSGVGGNVGAVGSGSSPGCACDPIACAPFFHAVPDVGGCCYHCELDLMQCVQASNDYVQLLQQLIDKYNSLGCMIDADCAVYYDQSQCGAASCGFSVPASTLKDLAQNLESYAQSRCSSACPAGPDIQCEAQPLPRCVMSRCQ